MVMLNHLMQVQVCCEISRRQTNWNETEKLLLLILWLLRGLLQNCSILLRKEVV